MGSILREKKQMEGYRAMCCEWRPLKDVFKDNVFYSLCLPQRPSVYCCVCWQCDCIEGCPLLHHRRNVWLLQ